MMSNHEYDEAFDHGWNDAGESSTGILLPDENPYFEQLDLAQAYRNGWRSRILRDRINSHRNIL